MIPRSVRKQLEKHRQGRERTVSDIIIDDKDEEIRRLKWTGIGMSLFFCVLWLGTMLSFSLYVRWHECVLR